MPVGLCKWGKREKFSKGLLTGQRIGGKDAKVLEPISRENQRQSLAQLFPQRGGARCVTMVCREQKKKGRRGGAIRTGRLVTDK